MKKIFSLKDTKKRTKQSQSEPQENNTEEPRDIRGSASWPHAKRYSKEYNELKEIETTGSLMLPESQIEVSIEADFSYIPPHAVDYGAEPEDANLQNIDPIVTTDPDSYPNWANDEEENIFHKLPSKDQQYVTQYAEKKIYDWLDDLMNNDIDYWSDSIG